MNSGVLRMDAGVEVGCEAAVVVAVGVNEWDVAARADVNRTSVVSRTNRIVRVSGRVGSSTADLLAYVL